MASLTGAQDPTGLLTLTLAIDSTYLSLLPQTSTTIRASFDNALGHICNAVGSVSQTTPTCPSDFQTAVPPCVLLSCSSTAPPVSISNIYAIAALFSVCPEENPNCGWNSEAHLLMSLQSPGLYAPTSGDVVSTAANVVSPLVDPTLVPPSVPATVDSQATAVIGNPVGNIDPTGTQMQPDSTPTTFDTLNTQPVTTASFVTDLSNLTVTSTIADGSNNNTGFSAGQTDDTSPSSGMKAGMVGLGTVLAVSLVSAGVFLTLKQREKKRREEALRRLTLLDRGVDV
ncbi:hypothetical protein HDU79_001143 [Rhizoclosmatium sp. JEL0117]|nr:hypothetical protein HDU79_001143 [Rhizoclosmatium sp. JEL0117]